MVNKAFTTLSLWRRPSNWLLGSQSREAREPYLKNALATLGRKKWREENFNRSIDRLPSLHDQPSKTSWQKRRRRKKKKVSSRLSSSVNSWSVSTWRKLFDGNEKVFIQSSLWLCSSPSILSQCRACITSHLQHKENYPMFFHKQVQSNICMKDSKPASRRRRKRRSCRSDLMNGRQRTATCSFIARRHCLFFYRRFLFDCEVILHAVIIWLGSVEQRSVSNNLREVRTSGRPRTIRLDGFHRARNWKELPGRKANDTIRHEQNWFHFDRVSDAWESSSRRSLNSFLLCECNRRKTRQY